jgi:hypothetical protein
MNEQMTMESIAQPGLRAEGYLTLQERFEEWLATQDGLETYRMVVTRAYNLRRQGFKHYSMKALWESIRLDRDLSAGPGQAFKLNNDYTSRMARRVMADYPDLDGFFEIREVKA